MDNQVNTDVKENRVVAVSDAHPCTGKDCGQVWPAWAFYHDLGVGICCLAAALDEYYAQEQASDE